MHLMVACTPRLIASGFSLSAIVEHAKQEHGIEFLNAACKTPDYEHPGAVRTIYQQPQEKNGATLPQKRANDAPAFTLDATNCVDLSQEEKRSDELRIRLQERLKQKIKTKSGHAYLTFQNCGFSSKQINEVFDILSTKNQDIYLISQSWFILCDLGFTPEQLFHFLKSEPCTQNWDDLLRYAPVLWQLNVECDPIMALVMRQDEQFILSDFVAQKVMEYNQSHFMAQPLDIHHAQPNPMRCTFFQDAPLENQGARAPSISKYRHEP